MRLLGSRLVRSARHLLRSRHFTWFLLTAVVAAGVFTNIGAWQLRHSNVRLEPPHTAAKTTVDSPADTNASTTNGTEAAVTTDPVPAPTTTKQATGKPATPRQTTPARQLIISPASVTIYKTPIGSYGIKSEYFQSTPLTISTADGENVSIPYIQEALGVLTSNAQGGPYFRPSWPVQAYGTYASVGSFDYTVTAFTSATHTFYSGKLHLTVKPLPVFTIPGDALVMEIVGEESYLYFTNGRDFSEIDLSQVGAYMPTITVADGWEYCTISLADLDNSTCGPGGEDNLPPGTYTGITLTFENQFQRVVVPLTLYVS